MPYESTSLQSLCTGRAKTSSGVLHGGRTPALSIAEVIGVNHNIASLFYHENREIIAEHNAHQALPEVEVDESFFVQTSQRQKRPGMPERSPFSGRSGRAVASTP